MNIKRTFWSIPIHGYDRHIYVFSIPGMGTRHLITSNEEPILDQNILAERGFHKLSQYFRID